MSTLRSVQRAVEAEARNLSLWPDGVRVQLSNRLTGAALVPGQWLRVARPWKTPESLIRTVDASRGFDLMVRCALSPDGRRIATFEQSSLTIWDAASATEVTRVEELGAGFEACAFGASSNWLLTCRSRDGAAVLIDAHTGREFGKVYVQIGALHAAATSTDGSFVVVGSRHRFDVTAGRSKQRLPGTLLVLDADGLNERFRASWRGPGLALSPDGTFLVAANDEGRVVAFDATNGTTLAVMGADAENGLTDCALRPDGEAVLVATDKELSLWSLTKSDRLWAATFPEQVVSCSFMPDASAVVAATQTHIYLWRPGETEPVAVAAPSTVTTCEVSPTGAYLATTHADNTLRLWDPWRIDLDHDAVGTSGGRIDSCCFTSTGDALIAASSVRRLTDHDPTDGTLRREVTTVRSMTSLCVAAPLDHRVVTVGSEGAAIWDLATGTQVAERRGDWTTACAWTRDGASILTGTNGGVVQLSDATTLDVVHEFRSTTRITGLAIWPPNGEVLVATDDKSLRLWNPGTGHLEELTSSGVDMTRLRVTRDGQRCIWVGDEAMIAVTDLTIGNVRYLTPRRWGWGPYPSIGPSITRATAELRKLNATLEGKAHLDTPPGGPVIIDADVTGDGTCLVTAVTDRTLRLWDIATGAEIAMLALPSSPTCVAAHPTLPRFAYGDEDGALHVVDLLNPA